MMDREAYEQKALDDHIGEQFQNGYGKFSMGSYEKYPIVFDACYKYEGEWNKAFVVGVEETVEETYNNKVRFFYIFCPYRGKLTREKGICVDLVYIHSIDKPDHDVDVLIDDTSIVMITDNLMIEGRMNQIAFYGFTSYPVKYHYFKHLWMRGDIRKCNTMNLHVEYLRVPIGMSFIRTRHRTELIGLKQIIDHFPEDELVLPHIEMENIG